MCNAVNPYGAILRSNDFTQYLQNAPHCSVNKGIETAKELLGENTPYSIEKRLDGEVVVFNNHMTSTFIEALTTDCISKMNVSEKNLLFDYMDYSNALSGNYDYAAPNGTSLAVVEALDKWLTDEVQCNPHPTVNECYDQTFVYESSCTN